MNKVILMGRLTKDPEVRYSQAAEPVAVARYTLAVDRRFKREGTQTADFIPCVAFGNQGQFAEKYFKKGQMVAVAGRLQIQSWDDDKGQRHWQTDVVVEDQYFAESRASFENRRNSGGFDYTQNIPPGVGGGQGGFEMNASPEDFSSPPPPSPQKDSTSAFIPVEGGLDDEDLPF